GGVGSEGAATGAARTACFGAGPGALPPVRQHYDLPEERLQGQAADGRPRRRALGGQAVALVASVPGEGAAGKPIARARDLPRRRAAPPTPAGPDARRSEPRESQPARAPARTHRARRSEVR